MTKARTQYDKRLAAVMEHQPKWTQTQAAQALKLWGRGSIQRRAKEVHDILLAEGLL